MLRHQNAPFALLEDWLRLREELCLSAILDCLVQLESADERQKRWRTKLPTSVRGIWLYLYLVIDVWSRLPGPWPACRRH